MKRTRFTGEQMVTILREGDERSVSEVAKKHGVGSQAIYGWRKHYGTPEPADVTPLPARAGKRPAEEDGGGPRSRDVPKEITKKMVGARVRRQVAYAHGPGPSSRRACALLSESIRVGLPPVLIVAMMVALLAADSPQVHNETAIQRRGPR